MDGWVDVGVGGGGWRGVPGTAAARRGAGENSQDGHGADGAACVRVHEVGVHVGEALEVRLVDAGQYQAVWRGERGRRAREELVEVLPAAATLRGRDRREGCR